MTLPAPTLEIAFATGPFATPTWVDVTAYLKEGTFRSPSRGFELDQIEGSSGSMVLDNADRRFEPDYTGSPYYPNVVNMRRCRLRLAGQAATDASLTVSGNEITDAIRALRADLGGAGLTAGQMCDAFASPDSSFGIFRAATNLFRRGQCDATTDWVMIAGSTASTDATVPAPFSAQSIKVVTTGGSAQQGLSGAITGTGLALAAGTSVVGSVWFKGVAGQSYFHQLNIVNTDATTTTGTQTTFTATGGWQVLVTVANTVAVGKTGDQAYVRLRINGTRAETMWFAHAMVESGQPVVAPYVATTGGSTSSHSAARVQAAASVIDETQGWVAFRVRAGWAAATPHASLAYLLEWRDDSSNQIFVRYLQSSSAWQILRRNSGGTSNAASAAQTFAADDELTIVAAWTATEVKISVNGGAFVTTANTHIPTLAATLMDIGEAGSGGPSSWINGQVKWLAAGTGTLSDADAATIHGFGNTDTQPYALNWPENAAIAAAWFADTSTYRATTSAFLWAGYVEEFPPGWEKPNDSETAVTLLDAMEALERYDLVASYPEETTGARIGRILDSIGFPASERSIDNGQETVGAVEFTVDDNQGALDHLRDVVATEGPTAAFFLDGRGYAVFHDAHHRLTGDYLTSQATFGDGDGESPYERVVARAPRELIINDARVTPATGSTQQATDATSQTAYGKRSRSVTTLHTSEGRAKALADFIVSRYKDPHLRFTQVEVMPLDTTSLWSALVALDFGDRITVKRRPPQHPTGAGGTVSKEGHVEGITWTYPRGEARAARVELQTSPADTNTYWVAASATNALAATTTRPVY